MRTLVTGANGFLGSHIVRLLLAQGRQVRALVRPESDLRNLRGMDVELAYGDLRDPLSLTRALVGCPRVFHLAAVLGRRRSEGALYEAVNVGGTATLMRLALQQGVERIVYTSTVAVFPPTTGHVPQDETALPITADALSGHYRRTKYLAERVILDLVREGLPVVMVHPTGVFGPGDVKPSPPGRIVLAFLRRRIPGYIDTGFNAVSVETVARGHLLAESHGRVGERYILGDENLTARAFFARLERLSGIRAPSWRVPPVILHTLAQVADLTSRVTGWEPWLSLETARLSGRYQYFSPAKAARELGLTPDPLDEALSQAVAWFRQEGYVR